MGHYDASSVMGEAYDASFSVTEDDKEKLIRSILDRGGKITLYQEQHGWEWPIVIAMRRDNDLCIDYDPEGAGHKMATVKYLTKREQIKKALRS